MNGIKLLEDGLWKSSHLFFKDDGPVSKGAKTRRFSVLSSFNKSLLGYVKWYSHWRKYVFYPINSIFDDNCLDEISQFMWETTNEHMGRLPNIKRTKDLEKKRRLRRIEQLTRRKKSGTIALTVEEKGSCIPDSEMQVVEGCQSDFDAPVVQGDL